MFEGLPRNHYGAILADPPWRFEAWNEQSSNGAGRADKHYAVMTTREISRLSIEYFAATDCALFLWATWPMLCEALSVMAAWGFKYKTCGFMWAKAHARQLEMFRDTIDEQKKGLGYWTRSNSEICLLGTRGRPKRLNADVWQVILEPRREHSRKPNCVHERIERLVAGPYLELFARQRRPGWDCWGNEVDKFASPVWRDMWSKPFDWSGEPIA